MVGVDQEIETVTLVTAIHVRSLHLDRRESSEIQTDPTQMLPSHHRVQASESEVVGLNHLLYPCHGEEFGCCRNKLNLAFFFLLEFQWSNCQGTDPGGSSLRIWLKREFRSCQALCGSGLSFGYRRIAQEGMPATLPMIRHPQRTRYE